MKFPYLINRIGFGGGEGGIVNPGPISHNELTGIQGGEPNEHYHLSLQSVLDLNYLINNIPSKKAIWVNPIDGNDSTASKGQIIKPFKTIFAALNASISGDLIVLFPGNYNEVNLSLKSGVNIFFMEGANCIPTNQTQSIFTDNGGAVNCSITGRGIIRNQGISTGNTNALIIGNEGSNVYVKLIELSSVSCFAKNAVLEVVDTSFTFEVAVYNGGTGVFRNCYFNESVQFFDLSNGNAVKLYNCRLKNTIPTPPNGNISPSNLFGIANIYHYHDGRAASLVKSNIFPYFLFKDCAFYSSAHNIVLAHRRAIASNARTTCIVDNCRFYSTNSVKNAIFYRDQLGNLGEVIPVDFKLIGSIGNTDLGGNAPIINQISLQGYIKELSIENYVI